MSKTFWVSAVCAILALGSATLSADRIRLRSGKVIDASFMGADAKMVRVLLPSGQVAEFRVEDITGIDFSVRKAPPPPTPDPTKAPKAIMLPAGTTLSVRLTQDIDVDNTKLGSSFRSLLDDPVMANGVVLIPRGSAVALVAANVQQSGSMKGSDLITLKANTLSFGGRSYDIVTTYVETKSEGEGKKSARKIGGGAGLGAAIGAIAGGGKGAAIGALAGAATGAVMAASGESHLKLPAETRLQFKLNTAVAIQP